MANNNKKNNIYSAYSRNSEALDYKRNTKSLAVKDRKKSTYTQKKKKENINKSTYLDRKPNTKAKYTKKNLKHDKLSVEKRRGKLIIDNSIDIANLSHNELKKNIIFLSNHKVKKVQKHSVENIVIIDGNTKKFSLSFINSFCILCTLVTILFFIDSNSRIIDAREAYEKSNNLLRETQTKKDNLILKTSTLSNDEEYKLIAKNKLGMDYPEKHQKIMVPMEKVNYSEIYISDSSKKAEEASVFAFIDRLWRKDGN